MPQQLQLFVEPASEVSLPSTSQAAAPNRSSSSLSDHLADNLADNLAANFLDDMDSDALLEQTRQLFQHSGSNTELMAQIMAAIRALDEICEQPPKHFAE